MLKYVESSEVKNIKELQSLNEFKKLSSFGDNNPLALVDAHGSIIFANNAFTNLFNIVEGKCLGEIITEPDLEASVMGLLKSKFLNLYIDLFLPDKQLMYTAKAERILISSKEYVLLFFDNIENKMKIEEKINNLHFALEYSSIPVIIINSAGKIIYATSMFEDILDVPLDILYNNSVSSVFSFHFTPDELSQIEKAIREGGTWHSVISYVNKEKQHSFLDIKLNPISHNANENWSFILSGHDITEYIQKTRIIKKSERRLKSIINNISDLLLILTQEDERILFVDANENFINAFKLDRIAIGRKPIDYILNKDFVLKIYEMVDKVKEEISFTMDFSFEGSNEKNYNVKVTQVEDNLENEKIYVISFNDISNRVAYERQLKKAMEKEINLNKLKTTLIENISHEIRTPANAIMGYSEIMRDSIEAEDYETVVELTDALKEVFNRVINLFTNIIEVSEIETEDIKIEKTPLNPNQILKAVYSKRYEDAVKKGLNFYLVLEKEEIFIEIDWLKFDKAISLLVDNAIKYTNSGEIVVISSAQKDMVEIIISDTGDGIEKSHLKRILEPFEQEDEEGYTRRYEGAGLGLTLAYKLIQLMGGIFRIQSEKNIGTKITIRFPKCKFKRNDE